MNVRYDNSDDYFLMAVEEYSQPQRVSISRMRPNKTTENQEAQEEGFCNSFKFNGYKDV